MYIGLTNGKRAAYKNPSLFEIKKCIDVDNHINTVKFIADYRTEEVLICQKTEYTTHLELLDMMDIDKTRNDFLFGVGTFQGNCLEISASTSILVLNQILDGQFDWLSEYHFNVADYKQQIANFRKQVNETAQPK